MAGAHIGLLFSFLFVLQFRLNYSSQGSPFPFHNVLQNSSLVSGDARFVENSSIVHLTKPVVSSSGSVIYKENVTFGNGDWFSTYFTFSARRGGSLAFLVAPVGFNVNVFDEKSGGFSSRETQSFVAVEYDLSAIDVGVYVGRSISLKSRNFSFVEGEKLHSWVDYQASYMKLEVRVSDGNGKPVAPLVSFPIDLNQMWANETMTVSLSSYNRNSSETCFLYLWGVKWMVSSRKIHSQPYDPNKSLDLESPQIIVKEKYCYFRLLAALIVGIACGALGAVMVVYLWTMIGRRRPVVPMAPEDCTISPVTAKKMKVFV